MKNKQYLEAAAHGYVATSQKFRDRQTKPNKRTKNLAKLRLEIEAVRFTADFLEEWGPVVAAGGKFKEAIKEMRKIYALQDPALKGLVKK